MVLLTLLVTGCSTTTGYQDQPGVQYRVLSESAISLEQLKAIKVSDRDCVTVDKTISYVERQLQLRGIDSEHPERLSRSDAEYNTTAKIIIWSLRIGCNNPNRYRS